MEDDSVWGTQSPEDEARALYGLIGHGDTESSVRELITVPAKIVGVLKAYCQAHPEDAHGIERALSFRACVLAEFEKICAVAVQPAELPLTIQQPVETAA